VQAYLYLLEKAQEEGTETIEFLKHNTFFGREKENLIYPITLANMVLHGIEQPSIWHGNTLTGNEVFGGLFNRAPVNFDIVLTNPPFGGKEGKEAQTNFAYKTGATQVLFLQHIIDNLKRGGRCAIVLDEGVLFRTNETAFVQTKRKLFDDCNVYCIISLPGGLFTAAGAGVKTNILFFEKGLRTENVWYYDLSDIKVNKTNPFTIDKLDDFFKMLPSKADSERSWTVKRQVLEDRNFDLKAVNPWIKTTDDDTSLAELLTIIEGKAAAITVSVANLKQIIGKVDEQ
jgi:type I restriction enzyme M protein